MAKARMQAIKCHGCGGHYMRRCGLKRPALYCLSCTTAVGRACLWALADERGRPVNLAEFKSITAAGRAALQALQAKGVL